VRSAIDSSDDAIEAMSRSSWLPACASWQPKSILGMGGSVRLAPSADRGRLEILFFRRFRLEEIFARFIEHL
jgi:hypothetical protein